MRSVTSVVYLTCSYCGRATASDEQGRWWCPHDGCVSNIGNPRGGQPKDGGMRIACPRWQEDGPWPPPWAKQCKHLRVEISTPIDAQTLYELLKALARCDCGSELIVFEPGRHPDEPTRTPPDP